MSRKSALPRALGFIGGAVNSAVGHVHYSAAMMDHQWEVTAGCFSRNPAINEETAQTFGVAPDRLYGSWREMLAQEKDRLAAVAVLTPIRDHYEMVAACLEAKIPVICEKALSSNSEEAAKLLALRDRHNGFLAVTYNYSGYPMVRELRRLIRSGILGRIIQFQAEMPQEGFIRTDPHGNKPKPQAWRLEDGRVPTLYLDLGAHLHHLLWYLTGESPLKVVAQQGTHGWFSDIIDNAGALCQYSGDVLGQFWFTKSALGHRNGLRLRLYGTEAACEWYQAAPEELLISHKDGRREIRDRAGDVGVANAIRYTRFKAGHPAGFIEAFSNIYTDIGECYDRYRATGLFQSEEVFSAELAFEGCRLLEAMHDSARKGAWETIGAGAGS